ncbi:Uncharacterised Sugar-binding Domain [Metamycoplasma cloacale]|uniref:coiled-coil domain-containing protein n=1 Tax=Metamycoplasma cloacale TaxID=92401 RepID=UPI0010051E4F|nr:FIVAR domain-containing protein [Metamycoplasma cloacale]VEU79800.1 Uncharacterised Sugar-binding Domain [Metamycoplasma cloacale]
MSSIKKRKLILLSLSLTGLTVSTIASSFYYFTNKNDFNIEFKNSKDELDKTIKDGESTLPNLTNDDDKTNLDNAINKAKDTINNPDSSKDDLDKAKDELNKVIEEVKDNQIKRNIAALKLDLLAKINEGRSLETNPDLVDEVVKQALSTAINDGQKVYDNASATLSDVENAIKVLDDAIKDAKASILTKHNKDIADSKDKLDKTIKDGESTLPNLTNDDDKTNLDNAINKAKDTINNPDSSKDDLDKAKDELNKVIEEVKDNQIKRNIAALKLDLLAKINEGRSLETNPDLVDEVVKQALSTAINDGQKVYDNASATLSDVENAIKVLDDAIKDANTAIQHKQYLDGVIQKLKNEIRNANLIIEKTKSWPKHDEYMNPLKGLISLSEDHINKATYETVNFLEKDIQDIQQNIEELKLTYIANYEYLSNIDVESFTFKEPSDEYLVMINDIDVSLFKDPVLKFNNQILNTNDELSILDTKIDDTNKSQGILKFLTTIKYKDLQITHSQSKKFITDENDILNEIILRYSNRIFSLKKESLNKKFDELTINDFVGSDVELPERVKDKTTYEIKKMILSNNNILIVYSVKLVNGENYPDFKYAVNGVSKTYILPYTNIIKDNSLYIKTKEQINNIESRFKLSLVDEQLKQFKVKTIYNAIEKTSSKLISNNIFSKYSKKELMNRMLKWFLQLNYNNNDSDKEIQTYYWNIKDCQLLEENGEYKLNITYSYSYENQWLGNSIILKDNVESAIDDSSNLEEDLYKLGELCGSAESKRTEFYSLYLNDDLKKLSHEEINNSSWTHLDSNLIGIRWKTDFDHSNMFIKYVSRIYDQGNTKQLNVYPIFVLNGIHAYFYYTYWNIDDFPLSVMNVDESIAKNNEYLNSFKKIALDNEGYMIEDVLQNYNIYYNDQLIQNINNKELLLNKTNIKINPKHKETKYSDITLEYVSSKINKDDINHSDWVVKITYGYASDYIKIKNLPVKVFSDEKNNELLLEKIKPILSSEYNIQKIPASQISAKNIVFINTETNDLLIDKDYNIEILNIKVQTENSHNVNIEYRITINNHTYTRTSTIENLLNEEEYERYVDNEINNGNYYVVFSPTGDKLYENWQNIKYSWTVYGPKELTIEIKNVKAAKFTKYWTYTIDYELKYKEKVVFSSDTTFSYSLKKQ